MLIRSQDKLKLININTINGFEISTLKSGICKIWTSTNHIDGGYVIGDYSTIEKALRVLTMIEEKYNEPIYYSDIGGNEYARYDHATFQMPNDEEVEI